MSIKNEIRDRIRDTIRRYDFEEAIGDALNEIDLEDLIAKRLKRKIDDMDFEPLVTALVEDVIDEQLDDIDLESEVLNALQEEFD